MSRATRFESSRKLVCTAIVSLALVTTCARTAFARQSVTAKLPTTSQVPAQKLDIETVSYTKDGKSVQKAFLPGGQTAASGYDGKVAWDMDPSGKVTLHHGDEVLSIARDADMYYHLHVLDYFKKLDVIGVVPFAGHQCYGLKGVNNWNQPNEQFYDKDSGLLIGYLFNTKWRGGPGETTATFEDYKNYGGVLMAGKTTGRDATGVSISLVTSVTYDDVDDSIFVLPDEVKKAVVQEKGAQ